MEKGQENSNLEVGLRVEVRFSKSRTFPGVLTQINPNGTYNVDFDNGEREEEIPRLLIRKLSDCTVTSLGKISDPESVPKDVLRYKQRSVLSPTTRQKQSESRRESKPIHDGDCIEYHAQDSLAEYYGDRCDFSRRDEFNNETMSMTSSFQVGDRVEAQFRGKGKHYYKGTVMSALPNDDIYDVQYDDGDIDLRLSGSSMRQLKPECTAEKERYKLYHLDGIETFKCEFDECEKVSKNHSCSILDRIYINNAQITDSFQAATKLIECRQVNPIKFEVGDRVEAKFRGRGKRYYEGKIINAHSNETYDIEYDDGDVDCGLDAVAIRSVVSPTETEIEAQCDNEYMKSQSTRLMVTDNIEEEIQQNTKYKSTEMSGVKINGAKDIHDVIKGENSYDSITVPLMTTATRNENEEISQYREFSIGEAKIRGKGKSYQDDGDRDVGLSPLHKNQADVSLSKPNHNDEVSKMSESETEVVKGIATNGVTYGSRNVAHNHSFYEITKGSDTFKPGDKVEALLRGRGTRWYKGTVSSRLPNGSYNIRYDDGDKDLRLPARAVRALHRPGTDPIIHRRSSNDFSRVKPNILSEVENENMNASKSVPNLMNTGLANSFDDQNLLLANEKSLDEDHMPDTIVGEECTNECKNDQETTMPHDSGSSCSGMPNLDIQEDIIKAKHISHGKGNRLYRGVVSKIKILHFYEVSYPDGSRDVNIPYEALHVLDGEKVSEVRVGSIVDVLSWQDRALC